MAKFYDDRKAVYLKEELWKTIQTLLLELTGDKIPLKEIRSTYPKWLKSSFSQQMSYGEFVMKLYWTPLVYDNP